MMAKARPGTTTHCQQRREAGLEEGKHRHRRGVGPASPDCDIEPLTEHGIGGAKHDRGEDHAPAKRGPVKLPREGAGEGECHCGDHYIATGAMKVSAENLARGAGVPQGVKRQLGRLPDKMAGGRKA